VPNEYPWGTTAIAISAYTLANAGAPDEGIATNYSTTAGNATNLTTTPYLGPINGPVRVGIFAANVSNSGRVSAGASYYGIMELGGNVWERSVTIANADGRAFTGTHGNGALGASGIADVATWPSFSTASGAGFRGGAWGDGTTPVSHRGNASFATPSATSSYGGRGVRLAP
jgi:hypothetical protein